MINRWVPVLMAATGLHLEQAQEIVSTLPAHLLRHLPSPVASDGASVPAADSENADDDLEIDYSSNSASGTERLMRLMASVVFGMFEA